MVAPMRGGDRQTDSSADAGRTLNDRQQRFVQAYLLNASATEAAIAAGYSAKTAQQIGSRLLQQPNIAEAVRAAQAERAERTKIDADYVLRQAVKLHERCMQEVKPLTDRKGDQVADEQGNGLFVFNAGAAAKSLELIGRHVGVQAFKYSIDHSGSITVVIERLS